jgi:DNA repair photolyase
VPLARVSVYEDATREVLSHNDSPDIPFRHSVNPYRGCNHGCAYCYARPTHEYLGFGAGTDFDTRIAVKVRAPELLARAFDKPSWKGELVVFSGVTDCYQPLEASYRLTRGCLEVCLAYRNPVGLITKAPLIERDLDVLTSLHREAHVTVSISIPFWRKDVARALEPGVATPERRMKAVERLAQAGIPVGVNVAPLIPGLDDDMAEVLERAHAAGARWAGMIVLRLPGSVKEVFESRLRSALPLHADKVMHLIRETRGGQLYDNRFGARQCGEGHYAQQLSALFQSTCQRLGLNRHSIPAASIDTFRRPTRASPQLSLF